MKERIVLALILSIFVISLVSAEQNIYLSSDDPKQDVSIEGESYSLELVSATDNVAVIKVSQTKEIGETYSENINGIKIRLVRADETNLKLSTQIKVIMKEGSYINLDSNDAKKEIDIDGKTYIIELVSASDTSATIKVSDNQGNSETKEVGESYSENINGILIDLIRADETNLKLSTSIIVKEISEIAELDSLELVKKEILAGNEPYLIELVSASDSSGNFKVSQMKEIAEGSSKKLAGLDIKVINTDENNFKLSASIVIGSSEIEKDEEVKKEQNQYSEQKISLNSESPSAGFIVNKNNYKIELISASDSSATLKVVNNEGKSETKEIAELTKGEINGVKIKVVETEEMNLKLSVLLIVYGVSEKEDDDDLNDKEEKEDDDDEDEFEDNDKDDEIAVCNGCSLEDKCYPLGYRKDGKFCSENKEFSVQLEVGIACENNFECSSNVCASGECIDAGLIRRILNWFKRLFGSN